MRAEQTPRRLVPGKQREEREERQDHREHQERGIALIAALMIMLLMSALMIGFTTVVMSDQKYRGIDKDRTRAYYGAQSGLEQLSSDLGNLFLNNVAPTTAQIAALANNAPTIPNVTFSAPAGVTAYGVTPTMIPCPPSNALVATCSAAIGNGPYQGLIALKKLYTLDAVARTTAGGEAHLTKKVESVAIPVFQFGTFSDVDLSFFAGATFNFAGRVHTNANLFLTAQNGGTTTIQDKVTAVGDIIRARMQNGLTLSTAGFAGTLSMATAPNTFRSMLDTEGSLTAGPGSAVNANWPTISIGTYNGYIRNGGCPPPAACPVPSRGTGAKALNLALITVGGANTDLVRRAPANEDVNNPQLFGERDFGKVSLRIMLSDNAADITSLPTVTATAPVRLGDEGGPGVGLTNDWVTNPPPASNGVAFRGVGAAITGAGTMTPIARNPGPDSISLNANNAACTSNAAGNCTLTLPVAGINLPATSTFNSPNSLQFDLLDNTGAAVGGGTVALCQQITSTQVTNCTKQGGGNLPNVALNYRLQAKDGPFAGTKYLVISAALASGTPRTYSITTASAAAMASNTFWMQSSADQSWTNVTCTSVANATPTSGGVVNQFKNCSSTPQATAANAITTAGATSKNTGTIGGYLKIEIQKADGTGWQDVTMEILNWGFADNNQLGTICDNPTPNAIIRLQRLKDNGGTTGACHYSTAGTNGIAVSTNSYDYWPQTIFDTREALLRDVAPANNDVYLGGVMHYVSIDVGNLNKWLMGVAPFTGSSGPLALNTNGYSLYFSDRRNNRDLNGLETGEYGWEDVVNPLSAAGTPNGVLDAGEDVNGNGTLETYGQFPAFMGTRNSVPPGTIAPFTNAATVRPTLAVGRSFAMTNRAMLFRRALMLENGTLTSFTGPGVTGLTVVTENPVYVLGDWNWNSTAQVTDPHAATSIIADAVTLLSSAWTDANSFVNPYNANNRTRAAANYYRVAIIAGKPPAFAWPAAGNPGTTFGTDGGAHNFLRYLELGGGTTNYRGAIATFYYNRQSTGTYKFGNSTVYAAPNRAYAFDTDFLDPAKLPPLTPVFRDLNALGFAQEIRPGK